MQYCLFMSTTHQETTDPLEAVFAALDEAGEELTPSGAAAEKPDVGDVTLRRVEEKHAGRLVLEALEKR